MLATRGLGRSAQGFVAAYGMGRTSVVVANPQPGIEFTSSGIARFHFSSGDLRPHYEVGSKFEYKGKR